MKKLKITLLIALLSLTAVLGAACISRPRNPNTPPMTDALRFDLAVEALEEANFVVEIFDEGGGFDFDFDLGIIGGVLDLSAVVRYAVGNRVLNLEDIAFIAVFQFEGNTAAIAFHNQFVLAAGLLGLGWNVGRNAAVVYIGVPAAVQIVHGAIGGTVTTPGGGSVTPPPPTNPGVSQAAIIAAFEGAGYITEIMPDTLGLGIDIIFAFNIMQEQEFWLWRSGSALMADMAWMIAGEYIAESGASLTRQRQGWWVWYGTSEAMAIFAGLL